MLLYCLLQRRNSFSTIRLQSLIRTFHNLNTSPSPIAEPESSTSFNFSQPTKTVASPYVNNGSDNLSSNPFSSSTFSFNDSSPTRSYGFLSAEEAAAERRRRKRRLRIEPPIQVGQRPPPPPRDPRQPDSTSALTGPRLNLHNRVQSLIRAFDLNAASNLARSAVYGRTRPTVFTCNAIIAAMHRAKRYEDSKALFKYFFEQNSIVPNVVSYNYLINSLCDEGNVDEGLAVYRRIIAEAPFGPSHVTFRHLTKGLIDAGRIDEAVDLLREMLNKGHGADSLVYNNLIKGFLDLGNLERADEFFNELKERCLVYDGVVNATYMEWWFGQGKDKEAMESYKSLLDKKYRMVPATCNVLLGVLVKNGKKVQAWDLFEHMLDDHTPPTFQAVNSETFSIMVNECFKEGNISQAIETFRRSGTKERSRPFAMDVAGYNNMIARFCENDMLNEAEQYFEELCSKSLSPDVTSFRTLIDAFLRLERIDDALRYFTKMVDAGLRVVASYGIVVFEKLIANGKAMESCKILTTMGEKDPKPDSSVYEVVVRGLCNADQLDKSKDILNQMMSYSIALPPTLKEFVKSIFQGAGRGDEIESILDESKWRSHSSSHQMARQPRFQSGSAHFSSPSSPVDRRAPLSQPSWSSASQQPLPWSSEYSSRPPQHQSGRQQTWSSQPQQGFQHGRSSPVGGQNTYQPQFGFENSSQPWDSSRQSPSWSQASQHHNGQTWSSQPQPERLQHVSSPPVGVQNTYQPHFGGQNSSPQWDSGRQNPLWSQSSEANQSKFGTNPAPLEPPSRPQDTPWQQHGGSPNLGMNAANSANFTWPQRIEHQTPTTRMNAVSPQQSAGSHGGERRETYVGPSRDSPQGPPFQTFSPSDQHGLNSNGISHGSGQLSYNSYGTQHSSMQPSYQQPPPRVNFQQPESDRTGHYGWQYNNQVTNENLHSTLERYDQSQPDTFRLHHAAKR